MSARVTPLDEWPSSVGLRSVDTTTDQIVTREGVELDYTSNELGPVLQGIVRGNGNYLERILGTTAAAQSSWLDELRPLVAGALTRHVARHYAGFARQQRAALEQKPTAKRLLYVLRTALTGIHALRAAEVVPRPANEAEIEAWLIDVRRRSF